MNASSRSMRMVAIMLSCTIVGLAAAGCERAEYRTFQGDTIRFGWAAPERPSGLGLPVAQREFLRNAALSALFEIEASRIAVTRGGSAAVRRFAEATLRDRVSADTDLQQLAASVGVMLPSRLNEDLEARLGVLSQLNGGDFDRAYARNVGVLAQEEALAAFERAADRQGERVQRFAADQIPALRRHLEWARRLAGELDKTRMA
jgi:putative membrane protein